MSKPNKADQKAASARRADDLSRAKNPYEVAAAVDEIKRRDGYRAAQEALRDELRRRR